ncbi:hypothetical protein FE784_07495 [Paenibacillus hemerocallicola]|uniref:Uncharacterized protein n=1 Tax=Paenibacillus hemerocallicola TaxID=1172614 RepID=A0A5C4TD83_9BACL|nr:hypothetical protein [Paenibacillus hemerocallicola]TNJ67034.1 hypothetical protein FE784_07495 [Paenibacillus hemerocallicola]
MPDSRLSVRPRRDYWQNGRNGVVFATIPEMMQISTLLQISASGETIPAVKPKDRLPRIGGPVFLAK